MLRPRRYLLLANVLLRLWIAKAGFLCTPDGGTFFSGGIYEDNLKGLLNNMAYLTPMNEAYQGIVVVGNPPNEVFGSARCLNTRSPSLGRGDSDPVCRFCTMLAADNALVYCPNMKEGLGSFDDCIMAWGDWNYTTEQGSWPPDQTSRSVGSQFANSTRGPQGEGTGRGSKSVPGAKIALIVACVCAILAVLAFILYRWRRRRKERPRTPPSLMESPVKPLGPPMGPMPSSYTKPIPDPIIPQSGDARLFDYKLLQWATSNFSESNMLGRGGFGPVFKGTLHDGTQVAIKKLEKLTPRGIEELHNEVYIVTRLRQKFLVKVLGYCVEGNEFLLVYEFLPNTSLDKFLLDRRRCAWLPWATRFNIIKGISRGLLYLHEEFEGGQAILHRDLKASNILLDENMNPKISDFGLARLHTDDQTHASTINVAGTL